ncbi:MAG TPA: carbohydrate kinase [Candidatus Avilachnospira avistercoris]|nr:carbohydrate kinase [Candidatus Avilachnospira avistercoris]
MLDVCAVGELLIDFATVGTNENGYPELSANPGGAPCNFLAALTKYGFKTAFIGKVGEDVFGDLLIGTLKDIGIDTKGIVRTKDAFTTLAFVTFDNNGERKFGFARKPGADTCLCFEDCDLSLVDEAKVFHFGTLSLTHEPARTATRKLISYAKSKGKLITFDPNLRKPLWDSMDDAKREIAWGLSAADIIKISDEEIDFLWGLSPMEGAHRILEENAAKLVFVTMGAEGAFYSNRIHEGFVPIPKVHPIDTTGAGDIFCGSALSRILKLSKSPEELTDEELRFITEFGSTAASLSTEHMGGIYSIRDEDEVLSRISAYEYPSKALDEMTKEEVQKSTLGDIKEAS